METPNQFDSIPFSDLLGDKLSLVVKLREQDRKTFREIGQVLCRDTSRARDLYLKAKRLQDYHAKGASGSKWYGLSRRTVNCLSNANLETREAVLAAFKDGTLHPRNSRMRNFGLKAYIEVAQWLGFPKPERHTQRTVCPHCGKKLNE